VTIYRKKPVEVEARRIGGPGAAWPAIREWCGGRSPIRSDSPCAIIIDTLKGPMYAMPGDWIIREPFPTADRQFYPCKPDIFEATYELAERRVQDGTGTDAQVAEHWRLRALAAEAKLEAEEQPVGYIVLTRSIAGHWKDDWDGEVHESYDVGMVAFRECSEARSECLLAELRPVAQHVVAHDPEQKHELVGGIKTTPSAEGWVSSVQCACGAGFGGYAQTLIEANEAALATLQVHARIQGQPEVPE